MKILIAGDFVPQNRVAIQINEGNYSCLEEIKPFINQVDYSIVNLECPVVINNALPIKKTGPHLHCTEKPVDCLQKTGFNCVTLANNHFRDYGQVGVEDTISTCKKYGIDYVGGGKNLADANQILYKDINGEKLAVINVCENEWSIAGDKYGGSAPLNPVHNYYAIQEARQNADFVLMIVHGGIEGYQYPTPRMQDTYRFFIDAGADAVVNHHQHCFSGYEKYKGKLIFYGLGNFCFDKPNANTLWQIGYMVMLNFNNCNLNFNIIPYQQGTKKTGVQLLKEKQEHEFSEKFKFICTKINNTDLLKQQFVNLTHSLESFRLNEFEPFSNKYIRMLQLKHWLPSFVSNKTRKDVYNVITCESHREVITYIFQNIIEKTDDRK